MICPNCRKNFKTDKDYNHKRHLCQNKDCRRCLTICQCHGRTGAMYVNSSRSAGIGSSSMFVKSRRAIGLEVEIADYGTWEVRRDTRGYLIDKNSNRTFDYNVVRDGSVTPSGLEVVFKPLTGDQEIINCLNTLAEQVYQQNCRVNTSCGYHVHVDARDYSYYDIRRLLTLWLKLESYGGIYQVAGRQPTTYCKSWSQWIAERFRVPPIKEYNSFKYVLNKLLYGIDINFIPAEINKVLKSTEWTEAHKYHKRQPDMYRKPELIDYTIHLRSLLGQRNQRGWNHGVESRYLNLNVHSWKYRGTIEYRLAAGTVDTTDIRMWPLFCLWLTEVVALTSDKFIDDICRKDVDPLLTIINNEGINIPSFGGPKLYSMPKFLVNWLNKKLN